MKHEWKKHEKGLYGAKQIPTMITVPMQNYIMIDGKGSPNDEDFSNRVAALYSLAYAIKMGFKEIFYRYKKLLTNLNFWVMIKKSSSGQRRILIFLRCFLFVLTFQAVFLKERLLRIFDENGGYEVIRCR